ncbi:hypothetical protein GGR56DRAFT_620367 [Xylariaceae sp. FL0804]|nr:hypothetical protein GGR56DRAFT_620367 [Xylariaceae sp. FL0804]
MDHVCGSVYCISREVVAGTGSEWMDAYDIPVSQLNGQLTVPQACRSIVERRIRESLVATSFVNFNSQPSRSADRVSSNRRQQSHEHLCQRHAVSGQEIRGDLISSGCCRSEKAGKQGSSPDFWPGWYDRFRLSAPLKSGTSGPFWFHVRAEFSYLRNCATLVSSQRQAGAWRTRLSKILFIYELEDDQTAYQCRTELTGCVG